MKIVCNYLNSPCGEMVDAVDSKSIICKDMLVQVRPGAHSNIRFLMVVSFIILGIIFLRFFSISGFMYCTKYRLVGY